MIPDYIPRFFNGIEMNEACEECQNFSSDSLLCDLTQNPTTSANILENNNLPTLDTKTDSVCPSVPLPAKTSCGFPSIWLTPPAAPPELFPQSHFH